MATLTLTGLYEEHAPVQATYIGAHVETPRAPNIERKPNDYKVLPGMVLFVKENDDAELAQVTPHITEVPESAKMYPFGVAHDPLLDGKTAMQNRGTGDVISAIVSGCVTIYAHVPDAKVGDTLYVHTSGNSSNNVKYQDVKWYKPPKFSITSGDNKVKLGSIVEVYPEGDGVVRVLLDVEGYDPDLEKDGLGQSKHPCSKTIDMAPQHPVYAQFMEGESVASEADKRMPREGMTFTGENLQRENDGDKFQQILYRYDHPIADSFAGIVTDTVPSSDQGEGVVGMISGVASVSINTDDSHAQTLPLGCKYGSSRVVARPEDYGVHYVVLRRGGVSESELPAQSAATQTVLSTFTTASSAAPKTPAQKKRRTAAKPPPKAKPADFGV